jgi:Zn-dependent protease with chaperone function
VTDAGSSGGGPAPARPTAPLRVLLLALLGYAVLGTTLFLLGVAFVLLFRLLLTGRLTWVVVKLCIFLGTLGWFILRALWVRIQPPSGLALQPSEAPLLFALVERVRQALRAPRVDTVLLTDDLNAGVAHVPWFGLAGPGRTYLILGLPLLQAVTEPQLEAILAHEFGHVSGKHTRFGAWVYRTRLTWARLAAQIEQSSAGAPLRAFVLWFYPRFDAASLAVARSQELQADRDSAEFAGARNAADALIASHLQGRLLGERVWSELARRNASVPEPPKELFAETRAVLTGGVAPELAGRWVRHALAELPDPGDTHPPLSERLRQLGEGERVPPSGPPASATLLGVSEARLERAMGQWWSQAATGVWQLRYQSLQNQRTRLEELEARLVSGPLPVEEAWEHGDLVEDLRGEAAAFPLFEAVLARAPDHARAHLSLGRILVLRDDPAAPSHLERAMQLDRRAEGAASQLLAVYWSRQGQLEEVEAARRRSQSWKQDAAAARLERSGVDVTDDLAPHGLEAAALTRLGETLARFPEIREAWLARKVVLQFPEDPFFVLAVHAGSRWKPRDASHVRKLAENVLPELGLPGTVMLVDQLTQKALARNVRRVSGSQVYRRAR